MTRAEMLNFVDDIVASFNEADYESLHSLMALHTSENVAVSAALCADQFSRVDIPQPVCAVDGQGRLQLNGQLAILATWLLLGAAHPDGVMRIIDRRISYRRILNNVRVTTENSDDDGDGSGAITEGHPQTILEVVLRYNGTCITQESLHALLARVVSAYPTTMCGDEGDVDALDRDNIVDTEELAAFVLTLITDNTFSITNASSNNMSMSSMQSTAETGVTYGGDSDADNAGHESGGDDNSSDGNLSGSENPDNDNPVQSQRRAYILELRLLFDHYDHITEWVVDVLASETV